MFFDPPPTLREISPAATPQNTCQKLGRVPIGLIIFLATHSVR
jgi:hypothetical protein